MRQLTKAKGEEVVLDALVHPSPVKVEVATAVGFQSGSSVSHQLRRVRGRLCEDKSLAGLLDGAESRLRREGDRDRSLKGYETVKDWTMTEAVEGLYE
jgi:hypothetical protein